MFLQARGRMTASELAGELEVSERTIYRDLEALHASGVPVIAERGPGGGCALPDNYRVNLTGLSESEVRGLFLSAVPGPLADLGLGKAVEAAVLKLTAALPDTHRRNLEQVRSRIHVDTSDWFRPAEAPTYLDIIQQAVWDDHRVIINYQRSEGTRVRRCIEPYGLVAKGTVWYTVAAIAEPGRAFSVSHVKQARRQMQTYRISRIQSAQILDEQFERPEWFDLHSFWETWCRDFEESLPRYTATIRAAPNVTALMPRLYGEGVRSLIENASPPDEDGWVTLSLIFDSFEGACASVLGLGGDAEVIGPPELRDAVTSMAREVLERYGVVGRALREA
jgi:predicted DNA-binding transcriptional regulator YafY